MSRKFALLMGLLLCAFAGSASADYYGSGYYDNDRDRYDDDDRYGDRYGDRYRDRYGGRIVRCESRDRRTVYCGVDTRGGVRLVDQHSDRRCIRGRTWGTSSRGIWVSNGCRASFAINARGRGDGRYGRSFRCESRDSRTVYCNVDSRGGVRLVRQLSNTPCLEGRTWGESRNGVWVSRGCRAEFRVGDRGGRDYGYRYDGYR